MAGVRPGSNPSSPLAAQELSMTSATIVCTRSECLDPSTSVAAGGRSSSSSIPARKASARSWFRYATASDSLHTWPSRDSPSGTLSPKKSPGGFEWSAMPWRTCSVRFSPLPSFSSRSTTLRLWAAWRYPPSCSLFTSLSPTWPNGVCPRSCPSAIASVRSSLRFRALEMVRAIWATSRVWVSRVT